MKIVRQSRVSRTTKNIKMTIKTDHRVTVSSCGWWWCTTQYVLRRYARPPREDKFMIDGTWLKSMNYNVILHRRLQNLPLFLKMKLEETISCPSSTLSAENEHWFSSYCDGEIATCRWTFTDLNDLLPRFNFARLGQISKSEIKTALQNLYI